MYPLAYFYLRGVMFPQSYPDWGMPVFAALFIVYVDCAARAAHRTAARETPLWAGCWLALAAGVPAVRLPAGAAGRRGSGRRGIMFAVWYVLARCGMLAQGQQRQPGPAGRAWPGSFRLPFGNFFLRARTVFSALHTGLHGPHRGHEKRCACIATAALTLALCGAAWGLLAAADANFAALGQQCGRLVEQPAQQYEISSTQLMYILLSLPVGAWLYGLVGGSLRRTAPPTTAAAVCRCAGTLPALCRAPRRRRR